MFSYWENIEFKNRFHRWDRHVVGLFKLLIERVINWLPGLTLLHTEQEEDGSRADDEPKFGHEDQSEQPPPRSCRTRAITSSCSRASSLPPTYHPYAVDNRSGRDWRGHSQRRACTTISKTVANSTTTFLWALRG